MHENFVLMATAKFTKFPCYFGDTKQFCSGGAAQLGSQKDVLKTIFSKNYMIACYSSSRFVFRAKGSVLLASLVILICSYEEVLPVIKKKLILPKTYILGNRITWRCFCAKIIFTYSTNRLFLWGSVVFFTYILISLLEIYLQEIWSRIRKYDPYFLNTEKYLWRLFRSSRPEVPRPATLLEKGLWHRCFSVNFAKFIRITFLKKHIRRLPLPFHGRGSPNFRDFDLYVENR